MAVQWLEIHASAARDMGSSSGWGTKTPYAPWYGKIKHKNMYILCDIFILFC